MERIEGIVEVDVGRMRKVSGVGEEENLLTPPTLRPASRKLRSRDSQTVRLVRFYCGNVYFKPLPSASCLNFLLEAAQPPPPIDKMKDLAGFCYVSSLVFASFRVHAYEGF